MAVMLRTVTLASPVDLAGFREAARGLLADGVSPEEVVWAQAGDQHTDLFGGQDLPQAAAARAAPSPLARVPAFFLPLCERAILHRDPRRFALMYRLLWRLAHNPALRHDTLDGDRSALEDMARVVRRDMHKMTAFVRFRTLAGADEDGGEQGGKPPLHIAWFEPDHHIVEATAPFFQKRFTNMHWAILTPERCVEWDGGQLAFKPGARRDEAPPADAGEALWLTYYTHIFNPARLKVNMMVREMPRRYWHNLPEAALIGTLTDTAHQRAAAMIEQGPQDMRKRLPQAPTLSRHPPPAMASAASDKASMSLDEMRAACERCRDCPIGCQATQAVFGEGPAHARLMVVGEQPGDQEDLQGHPFVGPAGKLFNRAVAELGWDRRQLYVTNAVKHFKYELRGKRRMHKTASQAEADACLQWLEGEIAQVKPKAVIALGATAARSLMGHPVPIMKTHGQWLTRADGLRVLITTHPSALLRTHDDACDAAYAQWLTDLAQAEGEWRE